MKKSTPTPVTAAPTHEIITAHCVYENGGIRVVEPLELAGTNFPVRLGFTTGAHLKVTLRRNAATNSIHVLSSKQWEDNSTVETAKPEAESVAQATPTVEEGVDSVSFYMSKETKSALITVDNIAKKLQYANVLIVGPSGYGKTTLAARFSESTGRTFTRINCAVVRDPEEWFGYREARDGSTVFEPTEFTKAISKSHSVILLDEVNRLEPWLLNSLFPLLDDDRKTVIHGEDVVVAPDVVFMMTLNQGSQYTGTFQLDEAFLNRTDLVLQLGPMEVDAECGVIMAAFPGFNKAVANKIVATMVGLRAQELSVDCSTRATKNVAKLIFGGMICRSAFEYVVINRISDKAELKKATDIVNSQIGVMEKLK
jgi:MoxR-like ATPase